MIAVYGERKDEMQKMQVFESPYPVMAVVTVEIYCLGLTLLKEGKRFDFVPGALPCRKYLSPTSQVCWLDMLEIAWTNRGKKFSRELEIHLTGSLFCYERTLGSR